MPWTPLGERLASLPYVLAGPIVRRAEPAGVTVWLALKEPRKVTLRVYASDSASKGIGQCQEGTSTTRRLGQSLHVAAVTSSGSPLSWGTRFSYQLTFGPPTDEASAVPETNPNLFTANYIAQTSEAAKGALLYSKTGAPTLPSFVLPPGDLNALRLIHASCRKPHGEGTDALQALDHIIAEAVAGREIRPHQLFLTGDQIYADDVADALLKMLTDAGDTLLGWNPPERLPVGEPPGQPAASLRPGARQKVAKQEADFSSSEAKSHLFSFGEFCAMYLFVWSDVLWPAPDDMPLFEAPTWQTDKPWSVLMEEYEEERRRLAVYRNTLFRVRRALANIATYMMCDDHEVTDDWYIHFARARRVLGKPLGKRVIQNGLAAFAVFQAWGNTPNRFSPEQAGDKLLGALARWDGTESTENHDDAAEIAKRVGVPTVDAALQRLVRPAGALDYHFVVSGPKHQVFVLDTRTYRSFPGLAGDPPALLDQPGQAQQLDPACQLVPAPDAEGVFVVVSPPPLIDVPFAELGKGCTDPEKGDRELWGFQPGAFESLLAVLAMRCSRVIILSGDVHYGYVVRIEYWADNPYGFPGQVCNAVMAQLTSSSLKNEASGAGTESTHRFHTGGYEPFKGDVLPSMWDRLGWHRPVGPHDLVIGEVSEGSLFWREYRPWVLRSSPAVLEVNERPSGSRIYKPEDWRYRVRFLLADAEMSPSRGFSPRPVSRPEATTPRAAALRQYVAGAQNHQDVERKWGNGKEVVGVNNLGDITFAWRPDRKAVVHQLWWWLEGPANPFPLSRWTVPLDPVPRPAPVWETES